jgi:AsmA family protein
VRRAFKILGWSVGALALLIGLAGVAVYVFVTSDYVRAQMETRAGAVSGRKTTIAKISIDWGMTSRVHLDKVEVANADWGKAAHMFKAEQIDLDIRVWPLLHGDFILPRLTLRKPEIYLERNVQDESNWSPKESPVVSGTAQKIQPKNRYQTPLIGQLEINDGRLAYMDAKRKLDLDGTVQTATGQAGAESQAELSLKGRLEGQPLSLHFVGGSALMLRETDKPYPINLDVAYGDTKLAVKGSLQDPFQYKGADVQLSLSGSDLADIFPLLGIPGPPTPPYRITGKLHREPDIWRVVDMAWHAGDSDLSGEVAIDQRTKPSRLSARLVSQRLAFADLAPLVGAAPGKPSNVPAQQRQTKALPEAKGDLFPNVPLHVERLRAMDMDVTLDAKRVLAPAYLPVQAIAARVQVENGQALVRSLDMTFGGGKITGDLAVDARTDNPATRANLRVQDVDLAAFFRGSRFFDTTEGKLQGRIQLAGSGRSLAQVMSTANGDAVVAMAGGSVSGLMVSLANLHIGDALVLYITGDDRIPIRCALSHLNFNRGTVVFDKTLMDTRKSVLHFEGEVALAPQTIKSQITADTKEFDLLSLHSPVLIEGNIRSPSISIGRKIPIPTPDLGGATDAPCEELTRQLLVVTRQ